MLNKKSLDDQNREAYKHDCINNCNTAFKLVTVKKRSELNPLTHNLGPISENIFKALN